MKKEEKEDEDVVIIMCPPFPEYIKQPADQSPCELFDCPKCKNKMWLSQRKKGMLMFSACLGKTIELGCYNCIKEVIKDNLDTFKDAKEINI